MSAAPILVSDKATGPNANAVRSDTEEENTEDEASTAQPAQESEAETPSTVNRVAPADVEARPGLSADPLNSLLVILPENHLFSRHQSAATTQCPVKMQSTPPTA